MQFHAEVDKVVNEAFGEQRKQRGQIKNDATNGALRVWLSLPAEWQAMIMEEPPEDCLSFLSTRVVKGRILEKLDKAEPAELLAAIENIGTK